MGLSAPKACACCLVSLATVAFCQICTHSVHGASHAQGMARTVVRVHTGGTSAHRQRLLGEARGGT
jgi:hypothetical protein